MKKLDTVECILLNSVRKIKCTNIVLLATALRALSIRLSIENII